MTQRIPVLQLVGYKRSGKTTLLTQLVKHLTKQYGLTIFTIKHHHGPFQFDQKGSDSWAHRQAGAQGALIQSPTGLGFSMTQQGELALEKLIKLIAAFHCFDLILVEGYKLESYPKLVLIRQQDDLALIGQLANIKGVIFHNKDLYQSYIENTLTPFPAFKSEQQAELFQWIEMLLGLNKDGMNK